MDTNSQKNLLIEMEKATLAAYKSKDDKAFTENFSDDYVGVANDGMQTAESEVSKMKTLDLDELHLENEKVFFPTNEIAIVTYKMIAEGKMGEQKISGAIYTSTVYIKKNDEWKAVLHTESLSQ